MANVFSSSEIVTISSTTGTLAHTPDNDFFLFERNGIVQVAGGVDYTLSGSTITLVVAQTGSDVFVAWYSYSGSGITFSSAETVTIASTSGTLAHAPISGLFFFTRNGILQQNAVDYTLSGSTVTVAVAQSGSDVFEAWYSYSGSGLTFSSSEIITISSTTGHTSQTPDNNFFMLSRNGVLQESGVDYSLAGTTITITMAQTGFDVFDAWYTYSSVVIHLAGDEDFWILPVTIPMSNDFMVTRF